MKYIAHLILIFIASSFFVSAYAEQEKHKQFIEIDNRSFPAEGFPISTTTELPACGKPCLFSSGHVQWKNITLVSAERKRFKRRQGGGYKATPEPTIENIAPYSDRYLLSKVREIFQVDNKDSIYDVKGLECKDKCWCVVPGGTEPLPNGEKENRFVEFEVVYERNTTVNYPPDESWDNPPLNVLYFDVISREWLDVDTDYVKRGDGYVRPMPGARGRYRFDVEMQNWAKVKAWIKIDWTSYNGTCEKFL